MGDPASGQNNLVIALVWTLPVLAQGRVQCAGEGGNVTVRGGTGVVQTSGTVKAVKLKTHSLGTVQCSGHAMPTFRGAVVAHGMVQCSGHIGKSRTGGVAAGMVQCSGFATVPYVGTTVPCLTTTTAATSGGTSGNRVY